MTDTSALFRPFTLKGVEIPTRITMAPMTRMMSPDQTPTQEVAAYYRRRAAAGVGLIITEGTTLSDQSATYNPGIPMIHGEGPLAGWKHVVDEVHDAGGKIAPQLWHVGAVRRQDRAPHPDIPSRSPSGLFKPGKYQGEPMTEAEIAETIASYAQAASNAKAIGFDAVEVHGAHGYLIDQFFWEDTNERGDSYGGDLAGRTRFAQEVIKAIRKEVGADFPIILRFSQWKQQRYEAKLVLNPSELETFLSPLADAGVDCFHASSRRYWEPEFEGSNLNLAGWCKKITGLPSITVGSISLDTDYLSSFSPAGDGGTAANIDDLMERLEREEFDLVAIGRALVANPDWPQIIREGRMEDLKAYDKDMLLNLY